MERLTRVLKNGRGDCVECDGDGDCGECKARYQQLNTLAAYESTGLTPDEIVQLKKENIALKKQKAQYEESVAWMYADLEELKELLREAMPNLNTSSKCSICKHLVYPINTCKFYNTCGLGYLNFEWQHADRARKVGVEV